MSWICWDHSYNVRYLLRSLLKCHIIVKIIVTMSDLYTNVILQYQEEERRIALVMARKEEEKKKEMNKLSVMKVKKFPIFPSLMFFWMYVVDWSVFTYTVKPVNKDHPRETRYMVYIDKWSLFWGYFGFILSRKGYWSVAYIYRVVFI